MKAFIWLACLLPLFAITPARAQLFSVTDLGSLGGTLGSAAVGINNAGTIAGFSYITGNSTTHAFSYSAGVMTDLGTLGGTFSDAYGINASGVVVGSSDNGTRTHAYSYSGGVMTDLGTLGGPGGTVASAINSGGIIAGQSSTTLPGGLGHAFSYSGGVMTDLGTLGGQLSWAFGINDSNTIVGWAYDAGNHMLAFSYSGGTMTNLGTFGGLTSYANAINNAGIIAGAASNSGNVWPHAFSYAGGVMTDLGTLGGRNSEGVGLNSSGVIVGDSYVTGNTSQHAYIDSGGVMTDLNTLLDGSGAGWTLTEATAINDYGQIVGVGTIGGITHAFLLDPIPEPSAWAMLIGGLGLLGPVVRSLKTQKGKFDYET